MQGGQEFNKLLERIKNNDEGIKFPSLKMMGSSELKALTEALKSNQSITELNLNVNEMGPEGARALAEALTSNQVIKKLNLSYAKIGPEGAEALAETLKINQRINELDLSGNEIGPAGGKALAAALKINKSITALNLSGTKIGSEAVKVLAEALEINQRITELNLSYNKFGLEAFKALAGALKSNRNIAKLNLTGNEIGPDAAKALAEAFKSNQTIAELNLSHAIIGSEAAQTLAEALTINQSITKLDLSYNELGLEAVKALAEVLKSNRRITKLNLAGNKIEPDAAKALAEALQSNQSVTELDLSYNELGLEGVKALAEALKSNWRIIKLNLTGNEIGPDAAKALAEALQSNQSVTELDLSYTKIGPEAVKALAGALKSQSITKLNLIGNEIGPEGAKVLLDALKTNHTIIHRNFDALQLNDEIKKIIARNKNIQQSLDEISQTINQSLSSVKPLDIALVEEKLTAYQDQFPDSSIIRLLIAKLNMLKIVNANNSEEQFKYFKLVMQDVGSCKNMPIALVPEMSDLLEQVISQLALVPKNVTIIVDQIKFYLSRNHPLYLNCQSTIVNMLFNNLANSPELISKQNDLAQCYAMFKNVQQQSPELLKIPETSLLASLMNTFDNTVETIRLRQTMESLKKDHAVAFAKATGLVAPLLWSLNPLSAVKFLSHFVNTLPDSTALSATENKVYLAPFKNNQNIYQMLYKSNDKWRSDRIIYFEDGKLSIHSDEDAAQDNYTWDKPLNEKIEHYFSETAQYSSGPVSTTPFWSKQERSPVASQENVIPTAKKSPQSI